MNLAIVDIETTDLKADKGVLLAAGIKPLGGEPSVHGLKDMGVLKDRYSMDKKLAAWLRDEMEKYDGWITWNGLMFDLPFINDRLVITGQKPLSRRFARGLDMMWHARQGKSTFASSRLDWVAKSLKCPIQKTTLEMVVWKYAEAEAIRGFKDGHAAYDEVCFHNHEDLFVTEYVYDRLKYRIQTISRW